MNDETQEASRSIENWRLGQTSARYESSGQGAGVISTGKGDRGGVSYGAYQLSTKMGTLREYLDQSRYGVEFRSLTPATPEFDAKWKHLARTDPGFAQDQHDFIGRTHYLEQLDRLKAAGLDLSGRGRAVQDAIWSTSVQFRGLTPRIFEKGIAERFGRECDPLMLSDREIVEAVQDYKIAHNASLFRSSPEWHSGLLRRANSERESLVRLAMHEQILGVTAAGIGDATSPPGIQRGSDTSVRQDQGVLTKGERSERVRTLQSRLDDLGYADDRGRSLKVDGDFGGNTESAVRRFQQAHGLGVDGIVGEATRQALAHAEQSPLMSERTHPDNPLFHEVRAGLKQLPSGTFRNDLELGNAAAALAAKAKLAGLTHIDHVVANTRGDGFIAVQGSLQDPARQLVSIDRQQAISQSIERSTAQVEGQAKERESAQVSAQMQHVEHRSGLAVGMRP